MRCCCCTIVTDLLGLTKRHLLYEKTIFSHTLKCFLEFKLDFFIAKLLKKHFIWRKLIKKIYAPKFKSTFLYYSRLLRRKCEPVTLKTLRYSCRNYCRTKKKTKQQIFKTLKQPNQVNLKRKVWNKTKKKRKWWHKNLK